MVQGQPVTASYVCQGELSPELCALDGPEAASPVLRLW